MDGKHMSAIFTYSAIFFFITVSGFVASASVEKDASKYIVMRVLPTDPALATSLLTTLLHSSPSSLRTIRRLLERQNAVLAREQDTMDDIRAKRREMAVFLRHIHSASGSSGGNSLDENINSANVDFSGDSGAGARSSSEASVASVDTGHAETQDLLGSGMPAAAERRVRLSPFLKPKRAMVPTIKRSLGRCIHDCINGKGNMNFIQCKSMCH